MRVRVTRYHLKIILKAELENYFYIDIYMYQMLHIETKCCIDKVIVKTIKSLSHLKQ